MGITHSTMEAETLQHSPYYNTPADFISQKYGLSAEDKTTRAEPEEKDEQQQQQQQPPKTCYPWTLLVTLTHDNGVRYAQSIPITDHNLSRVKQAMDTLLALQSSRVGDRMSDVMSGL
jgi:hypothetical protein